MYYKENSSFVQLFFLLCLFFICKINQPNKQTEKEMIKEDKGEGNVEMYVYKLVVFEQKEREVVILCMGTS